MDSIVIIGGTSGIGLATAKYLNNKSRNIIISGRTPPEESDLNYQPIDITDENSVDTFFHSLKKLNGLVLCAGITKKKESIESFSVEHWDKLVSTNVTGSLLCLKYAYPFLKKTKGRVVVVNSIAARTYSQFSGFEYTMTKSALSGMVKQLSIEWAKDKISINSVFPSMTDTPMLRNNVDIDFLNQVKKGIPLGEIASTNDVARAIAFLLSKENNYITGSGIDINGGQYLNA